MQPKLVIFGILLASILLLGCMGSQPQQGTNKTQTPTPSALKTPSFTITSPTAGQIITIDGDRGDVALSLNAQNLVLKAPGGAASAGEGHFRVTIDGGQPLTVLERTYVMAGLVPGSHTVKVELLNNDNTAYVPPLEKTVAFVVQKSAQQQYVPVNYQVTINNLAYTPSDLTAKVGDTITFYNAGNFPMSATCFVDGKQVFDTRVLAFNQSATITLDQAADCTYYSTTQRLATGHVLVHGTG